MFAALEPTTVLLIAAPVAVAVFLLVVVLFASARSRPAVATRLERDASRRERARQRALSSRRDDDVEAPAEAEHEPALVGASSEPGQALALPTEVGPPATIQAALEEAAKARLVAPPVPRRDPEKAELDRRQFLNRGIFGGTVLGLGFFGAASLAFMYPKGGSGFGSKVNSGTTPEDAKAVLENSGRPFYNGEGRFYVVPFKYTNEVEAQKTYTITFDTAKAAGVMAVYQKCAHLGCRVPFCDASGWFECPCHGSQYNGLGEIQRGPAPRGLSRFLFSLDTNGIMIVDTAKPLDAPPKGVNTPGEPEPPNHCVAG